MKQQLCGRQQRNVRVIAQILVCYLLGACGENATIGVVQRTKQFDMVLRIAGSASYSYNNTMVRAGHVEPQWSSQCSKSKESRCKPRQISEYTDQLFFEFSYDSMKNFDFLYPTIKTSGGRAKAEIMDYAHDMDERNGELIIRHKCKVSKEKSNEQTAVTLSLPLTSEHVLEIGWIKVCGFGEHEKLDYGIISRKNGVQESQLSLKAVRNGDEPIVGPGILSTRVYLRHDEDEYSQGFAPPRVEISEVRTDKRGTRNDKGLSVDVKGSGFVGDIVMGRTASVFDLFYNCHARGMWKVEAIVKIEPFEAIRAKWIKDCGGGPEKQINIGTKAEGGLADVVSEGVTAEKFGSRAVGNEDGIVSGKGSGTKAFFLWTRGLKRRLGSISIGGISADSYDDRIAKAEIIGTSKLYERAPWRIAGMGEEGERIAGEVKRIIGVKVECKRKGKVRVGVRISVHDREGIEWWFFNECGEGRKRKRGVFVTAQTVTYVMMSGLCAMMVLTLHRAATSRVVARAGKK